MLHYQPKVDLTQRRDHRRRGAAALAASGARHAAAAEVHSAGRGDRPDRADRPLGAAHGVRAGHGLAARGLAGRSRWRSTCRRGSSSTRTCCATSRRRWRRAGMPPKLLQLEITESMVMQNVERGDPHARRDPGARRAACDRRFRHRLFVDVADEAVSDRHHQDRPLVRARPRGEQGGPRDRHRDHHAWARRSA